MRLDTFGKLLPVNLTKEELLKFSKELAVANQNLSEVEDKKKTIVADFTSQSKAFEASISSLSRKISTEEEFRDIDCKWEWNKDGKTKSLIRLDTKEKIQTSDITNEDRQQKLDLEGTQQKEKKKGSGKSKNSKTDDSK